MVATGYWLNESGYVLFTDDAHLNNILSVFYHSGVTVAWLYSVRLESLPTVTSGLSTMFAHLLSVIRTLYPCFPELTLESADE